MSWVLKDSEQVGFWIYEKSRPWWKRLLGLPAAYPIGTGLLPGSSYRVFEIRHHWYDSESRVFDTTFDVRHTFEETLAEGYAIYDWRSKRMVYP